MSKTNAETATSYAALILADSDIEITPEKLQTLIKAAGIEDVEPIWTNLFAKALKGKDVKELCTAVTAAGPVKAAGEGEGGKEKEGEDGGEAKDGEEDGEEDGDDSGSEMGLGLFD